MQYYAIIDRTSGELLATGLKDLTTLPSRVALHYGYTIEHLIKSGVVVKRLHSIVPIYSGNKQFINICKRYRK